MSDRVVGGVDGQGRAVARKRASTAAQRASLEWEAAALAAAGHPGVVDLLDVEPESLTTAYAGTHSLATGPPLTAERIMALGAAVAATVADLHSLGIVHGRVDPSHVVLGPDGRPLLCGFSGTTLAGRAGPPTSPTVHGFADPRLRSGDPTPPAADVYAIGAVLRFLLLRGGGRRRPLAGRRRCLDSIVRRATAPEPHRRPTARALAAELSHAPSRRTRGPAATAAAAGLMVVTSAIVLAVAPRPGQRASGRADRPALERSVSTTTTVRPAAPTTTTSAAPAPEVLGPNLIAVGNDRYQAGAPSDQVVIGDWDCDGVATVALLRSATGEVFVFNSWATARRELSVAPVATVPGAVGAAARDPDGDGCAALVVERADGHLIEIEP